MLSTVVRRFIPRSSRAFASAGYTIPSDITLDYGFPPTQINLADRTKGRNVIILGLPGAFTPTV